MKIFSFHYQRFIILFLVIALTTASAGCSGQKKEIQRLFLVLAVGIDATSDNKVEVTMQVLNPSASQSQSGESSGPSEKDVIVLSGIGDTFFDAVYEASKTMSRVQHFGHTKYIVMSDAFARKGIREFIDSLSRTEEVRLNTPILVTRGRASDLVRVQTPKSPIPAIVVENLLARQELIGFRPFTYLIDLFNSLTSETSSSVAAVLEIGKSTPDNPDRSFVLAGSAVFKKDKLIGYLDAHETRGMQWVKGTVQTGSVSFNDEEFGKVTCEVFKTSSKIKPTIEGDRITIDMEVKVFSDIRRIGTTIDPVKNPEVLDKVASLQSKAIKNEIEITLDTAKSDLDADIFNFGEAVHRKDTKNWGEIKKDWPSLYQSLTVNVNVISTIRSSGLINKSL